MIKKCKNCGTLSNEIKIENIGKINTRKLCNDCILLYQKCIAKSRKRIKLFFVPYGEDWENEIMKMKKKDIVQMLRRVCKRRDEFEKLYFDLFDKEQENEKGKARKKI